MFALIHTHMHIQFDVLFPQGSHTHNIHMFYPYSSLVSCCLNHTSLVCDVITRKLTLINAHGTPGTNVQHVTPPPALVNIDY